jgi:putative transcriptional regulator
MSKIIEILMSSMLYFECKEKLTSRSHMEVQTSDLKQVRKAAGLTQAQLAQLTGVSRQTIIATERGDYAPSVFLALRISRALNTTVEEIFSLQEESR